MEPNQSQFEGQATEWLMVQSFCFIQYEKYDEAIHLLEVLKISGQANAKALLMLSKAYLAQSKYKQALDTLNLLQRKFGKIGKTNPVFELLKSQAMWGLEEPAKAQQHMKNYIQGRAQTK